MSINEFSTKELVEELKSRILVVATVTVPPEYFAKVVVIHNETEAINADEIFDGPCIILAIID